MINLLLYLYFPVTLSAIIFYALIYNAKDNNIIKIIVSELPIAQLSSDDNFHAYNEKLPKRYSLLYIPLGIYKFYFFSWTWSQEEKDKKFNFFKILSLDKICDKKIENKEKGLDESTDKNYERFKTCNKEDRELHIKILEDKCKEFENRKSVSQFKAGFYFTTLALVLTTIAKNINEVQHFSDWTFYKQITFILILLYIINAFMLLFSFISVKGFKADMYSTFARANEKEEMFYDYWYKKFQRLQVTTTKDVSFILNIEHYLKLIVTWSMIFTLILMIGE